MTTAQHPELIGEEQIDDGPQVFAPAVETGMAWLCFVGVWLSFCVGGLAIATVTGQKFIAVAAIVPVTLVGIIWKPTFGLCVLFLVAPIGRLPGLSPFGEALSVEKGFGFLFFIGVGMSTLAARVRLRLSGPAAIGSLVLAVLSVLSILWALYPQVARSRCLTLFQFAGLGILVASVARDRRSLIWPLRLYLLSCLLAFAASQWTGFGTEWGGGRRATLAISERVMNTNDFANILGVGAVTAIYLNRRDPVRFLRWLWAGAVVMLPLAIIMTGSRGGALALLVTMLLPLVLLRQLSKSPLMAVGVLVITVLTVGLVYVGLEHMIASETADRLTDLGRARQSFSLRVSFITQTIAYAFEHPLGAGMGCFFTRTGHAVHNDPFYLLGALGFPGAAFYVWLTIAAVLVIRRAEPGWEKWYIRGVFVFLTVMGQSHAGLFYKHYWMFLAIMPILAGPRRAVGEDYEELRGYPMDEGPAA